MTAGLSPSRVSQTGEAVGLRGELRLEEPLSRHTSWRVGGRARRFYRPADAADLAAFLCSLEPAEPLLWLGLGSNLLVDDSGFPGTVIHTQGRLGNLERINALGLRAECGVPCAKLARFAARAGLAGLEFLAGIPGTLGGALALNAGAHGGEIWTRVRQVTTIDRGGRIRERGLGDFRVGYRQVEGPAGEWFLAANLELEAGEPETCQAQIRALLERRNRTQPIGEPSCGSVFRNPPGDYAARLIEAAGLKGEREGGAQVSTRHANFIVNTGGASARDILALMARIQARVEGQSGVRLQPEVHCIGGIPL